MKNFMRQREIVSLLFIVVLFLAVGIINHKFLASTNIFQIINSSSIYAFVALGMSFVLFTGEIDVSVGATLGFSAAMAATLIKSGTPLILVFLYTLIFGCIVGLINALGIVILKVPSIIMTLGTMGIVRGLMYIYTGGQWLQNLPSSFTNMSQKTLFSALSIIFIICLIITIGLFLVLKKTFIGKSFLAVGDNIEGARLIGISVNKIKFLSFVLCGSFSAIAGVLYASRVGFVTPVDGTGYEMTAIAACVIGGISLAGGEGTSFGALIGAILMSSISSILVFLGFPSTLNNMITGFILIAIVIVSYVSNHQSVERLRKSRLAAKVQEFEGE